MVKVAIIGASGYTGLELVRLLAGHPKAQLAAVTSREHSGLPTAQVFASLTPGLRAAASSELVFVHPEDEAVDEAEFVFTALPHQAATEQVVRRLESGQRVIDLSADFRFRDPETYAAHYAPHLAPELCREAVYGLCEIYAEEIKSARLVGNPGCYPTCALLALIPLLKEGLISIDGLIIDAKTGVSGAGRKAALSSLLAEAGEDLKAYNIPSHRHRPEMEQELKLAAGVEVKVVFTPHLAPMSRGMLATMYAQPLTSLNRVLDCWREFYASAPFICVLKPGQWPRTQAVRGSNMCHLNAVLDEHTQTLILLSAIDNLTKGASGQAVQCLNLMAGFEETLGLPRLGLMP